MNEHDRFDGASSGRENLQPVAMNGGDGSLPVNRAVRSSVDFLLSQQNRAGFWVGELEADSSLESDAILLDFFLGNPNRERVRKLSNCIREEQTADGGWQLYPAGPPNVSLIVKAYLALRLAGVGESDRSLQKAAELARSLGGVEATNNFTRIYLCLLGQYDWQAVPAIPPELVLIPKSAYVNIYEMSCWTRAILVPLSIIYAHRPSRTPPPGVTLDHLFLKDKRTGRELPPLEHGFSWKTFFHATDWVLRNAEQHRWKPLRRTALRAAEKWMIERLEGSDGLGAIFPAIMNAVLALDCLGYSHSDPVFERELGNFWRLAIEERDSMRMQPCFSPIWDTAIALFASAKSGLEPTNPALRRGAEWLISKQVLQPGDWAIKNSKGEPGGWAFEFANEPYPDVDDTAMVLLALSRVQLADAERQRESMRRGLNWLLSMQSSDGGWASFELDSNKTVLCKFPYADHNAMLDPSTADITGRVLEMLGSLGYGKEFAPARRGIEFLRRQQEPDGSWFGRWGVNYIYGTCFALRGLAAMGVDMREAFCLRAAEWLRSYQNPDGGWGESCDSYDDPNRRGIGPSTAAQTAWALLGLFASCDYTSDSVNRGVQYLLRTQKPDGGWVDEVFTGTGFPCVFYLKYHLYSVYFPLLALSEYSNKVSLGGNGAAQRPNLQIAEFA
jgi:squalene-hopene/tetraprenyl-beta-curcumene cyclase